MVLTTSRKIPVNSDLGWIDIPIPEGRNPQTWVSFLTIRKATLQKSTAFQTRGKEMCLPKRQIQKVQNTHTQNDLPESSLIFTETILQTRNLRLVQSKPKTLVSLLNPNFSASKVHMTPTTPTYHLIEAMEEYQVQRDIRAKITSDASGNNQHGRKETPRYFGIVSPLDMGRMRTLL